MNTEVGRLSIGRTYLNDRSTALRNRRYIHSSRAGRKLGYKALKQFPNLSEHF